MCHETGTLPGGWGVDVVDWCIIYYAHVLELYHKLLYLKQYCSTVVYDTYILTKIPDVKP